MPPLRFRIRTILSVIAIVGVHLGFLIGVHRVLGARLDGLVAQALVFWAVVGVNAWKRNRGLTDKARGIPSGEPKRA
jgi:hypothetical protein